MKSLPVKFKLSTYGNILAMVHECNRDDSNHIEISFDNANKL